MCLTKRYDIIKLTTKRKGVIKMRKQVMVKAWKIAREAAAQHGGKAVEYISGAMKQAWSVVKGDNVVSDSVRELIEVHTKRNDQFLLFFGGDVEAAVEQLIKTESESGRTQADLQMEWEGNVYSLIKRLVKITHEVKPELLNGMDVGLASSQMLILAQTKGYEHVVSGLERALRG